MNCRNCGQSRDKHQHGVLCPTNDADAVEAYHNDSDSSYYSRYQAEYPKYLNVYQVDQIYGGPEEGGWWYDVREPFESVRVDNKEQEDLLRFGLMDRYDLDIHNNYVPKDRNDPERARQRGRTSAAGGYDVEIRVEYEFAQPFPKERPRYE